MEPSFVQFAFAFLLLQVAHSLSQSIISSWAAIIQYLVDNKDNVWLFINYGFPFTKVFNSKFLMSPSVFAVIQWMSYIIR